MKKQSEYQKTKRNNRNLKHGAKNLKRRQKRATTKAHVAGA